LLTVPLAWSPIQIGHFVFSLYWMLLGLTLTVVGMQSVYLGCVTQILHDYGGEVNMNNTPSTKTPPRHRMGRTLGVQPDDWDQHWADYAASAEHEGE
jgi:hypothetical protein